MWYLNFGSTTYACGLFSGFSEIDISSRLSHDLISQALATCFFGFVLFIDGSTPAVFLCEWIPFSPIGFFNGPLHTIIL